MNFKPNGLRKIEADKIFDGYHFQENKVLVLKADGEVEGIVSSDESGEDVEHADGILTPGFINCHCHLELSHMKGVIPEKTGLVDFVFKIITERHHSDEEIKAAISKAEDDMLKNGIVAVGDICNNGLTIDQKKRGRLYYYNFIEASGWLPAVAESRLQRALELLSAFECLSGVFHQQAVVPHAPYSVSEALWPLIQPYFQNKLVSMHNQEAVFEDQFFEEGKGDFLRMYQLMKMDNGHHQPKGKTSIQSNFQRLAGADRIMLVHNSFTQQRDIDFIRQSGKAKTTIYCICANANRYIENALPPIPLFRKNNCRLVLGTDSLASNWSLSIANEINTIQVGFPEVPLEEILRWATSNGASTLGLEKKLGSFEKGKKPGVISLKGQTGNLTAMRII